MAKGRARRPLDRREAIKERSRRRLKLVIFILVLAILGEAGYLLSQSSFVNVQKISVQGNSTVSKKQILKKSRITKKTSYWKFSISSVKERVEQESWIKTATVKRRFPLDLVIIVKERAPVAVIMADNRYYLVDREGVVLDYKKENPLPQLPLIKDVPPVKPKSRGQQLSDKSVRNALSCLRGFSKEIVAETDFISAPSIDGLSLHLKSGLLVLYGKAELTEQKNYAIDVIIEEARKEQGSWQYIDVRVPSNPAAMPAT